MFSPTHYLALVQSRAYRALRQKVSIALDSFNVSMGEWTLLGQLNETKGLRLSEVASTLGVEAPLVTNAVKALHAKGFVALEVDSRDTRAKLLTLTKQGEKMLRPIEEAVRAALQPLLKGVSAKENQIYFKVLQRIVQNSSGL
ncbi:MAG TPA: MarR family transcriptional regulator [Verrucomicrobiae bacterium]|nr:MarR family transcriptional regulator [Verrucomicrobiae bacterium]